MSSPPEPGTAEYEAYAAENKGPWILITCWVVTAISTLFVIARVYVRGFMHGKLQQDDWWTIIAMVCGYISTALSTLAVASGNGRHMDTLTEDQQQAAILWTTAAFCPGIMSFGLPKLAVVYLLTKLLNPATWHKWFLWWQGIWCQLTLFATVGVLLGRCTPAASLWDFSIEGTCFSPDILVAYCIYAGAFSAFVDLYLAIYPAIILFKLQMTLKKKLALVVALGIGAVSGVVAIYKTTRIPSLASEDFSYDTADLVVWTVIEGSTIIMASSIPILQPLADKVFRGNPFSSNKKGSSYPQRYYEDYSDAKSGYELGQRKPKSKQRDDLGLTVMNDDESQEEILGPNENGVQGPVTNVGGQPQAVGKSNRLSQAMNGKIMRTDIVTVTYDEESNTGSRDGPGPRKPGTWQPPRGL